MAKMIARCGLICTECPAYLATQADDDKARAEVAARWSKELGGSYRPEDINCDGCLAEGGRLFSYCGDCAIRACGAGRAVANCGECADYGCERITGWFGSVPSAKAVLDEIAARRK